MTDQVEQELEQEETVNLEEAIRASFDSAVAEELAEDDTKMRMISSGATFKNVTRLYNQFMIDAGFAISKEDRNKAVEDTLEGREFDTEELFDEAVAALVEAVKGSTERSAAALVRSYCKKNELDIFAKPKSTGNGRTSFASKYYDLLKSNPGISKEEATAYINGDGDNEDTSDNVKKSKSHYLAIWKLVSDIHNA
ncbi:MAG: hypothetical protein GY804_02955 [Alphaproteobacteria bacterium]|nr:hypothetical protein [Alteromonadales bacterium]MCP4393215.1 hypothetical protein [Alphaproteobacteria bacterium]